jgi:hypothetical protein
MYTEFVEHVSRDHLEILLNFLKSEIESSFWSVLGDSEEGDEGKGEGEGEGDQDVEMGEAEEEGGEEGGNRKKFRRPLPPSTPISARPDFLKLRVSLRCLNLLLHNIPGK